MVCSFIRLWQSAMRSYSWAACSNPSGSTKFTLPGMDLPEHGLHDRFPPCINRAALLRLQLPSHAFPQRRICRDPDPRSLGNTFTVLHSAGRDEKLTPASGDSLDGLGVIQICCGTIPGIPQHLCGEGADRGVKFLYHRYDLFDIHSDIRQRRRDDHLMLRVHNGLRVIGVTEGPVGRLHDRSVRVGEVALSLRSHDRILGRVITAPRHSVVILTPLPGLLLRVFPRPSRRVRLQRGTCFRKFHQARLPPCKLRRQLVTAFVTPEPGIFRLIDCVGPRQQCEDFLREDFLLLAQKGRNSSPCALTRSHAPSSHPTRPAPATPFRQRDTIPTPARTPSPSWRGDVCETGQSSENPVPAAQPISETRPHRRTPVPAPATSEPPHNIRREGPLGHQPWVIRRLPFRLRIRRIRLREVQLGFDDVSNESREVILRQPLIQ